MWKNVGGSEQINLCGLPNDILLDKHSNSTWNRHITPTSLNLHR
jgi:hypothetical protein